MGCVSSKSEQIKEKALELKAKHEEQQQTKWRAEVLLEDGVHFHALPQWIEVYEKSKENSDDADDKGPSALEQKARASAKEKVTAKITGNVLVTLDEVVAQVLGTVEQALAEDEPDVAAFVNGAAAVALTYRFGNGREKAMAYVRTLTASRVALTLGAAVDALAEAAGHAPDAELNEEQVQAIVDALVGKVEVELNKTTALVDETLQSAPLFQGGETTEVDAGIVALQDFLRGFMQSKVEIILAGIREALGGLVRTAATNRQALQAAKAELDKRASEKKPAEAAGGGESGGAEEDAEGEAAAEEDPEELQKVRDRVLADIEKGHEKLEDAVSAYVGDLVSLVMPDVGGAGGGGGGGEAAEATA